MDAITVETLMFGVDFFKPSQLLYLHCIDFQFVHNCTIKSLPFMTLKVVGGHVSFPVKLRERRIVLFPDGEKVRELTEKSSPCIIQVITCCNIEVFWNSQKQCLLIWDFVVQDSPKSTTLLAPLTDYEDIDPHPTMPWLDVNKCKCNCSRYPDSGTIVQNIDTEDDQETNSTTYTTSRYCNDSDPVNGFPDDFDAANNGDSSDGEDNGNSDTSDLEDPELTHTLPFKVIGVAHSLENQKHLENCLEVMNGGGDVEVRVNPEPDNEKDPNAISVQVNYSNAWYHVGYIASELTPYVHSVLQSGSLIESKIAHIKFRVHWLRAGFYMKLLLTIKGVWDRCVLRLSRGVQ